MWETGTAIDEFTPIYLALARQTDRHGAFSPDQVDRMDLTVVAVMMGVGVDVEANEMAELAELGRMRRAGQAVSWDTKEG